MLQDTEALETDTVAVWLRRLLLFTDKYELTMLAAALQDGSAHRRTTFEVFARRLAEGRRYGVVAGTARFVEALAQFRFDEADLASLEGFLDADTLAYLADYRFSGDVDGYAEGELYFPGSPVLSVHGTFAECVRARDAGAVDLQPRHCDRVGRRTHGQRREGAAR